MIPPATPGSQRLRVTITTVGCRSNQADSTWLARALDPSVVELVAPGQPAHIHVINSCAVTARAERDVRRALRIARASSAPEAQILLTGCMVTAAAERLGALGPFWMVVPGVERHSIPELIHAVAGERAPEPANRNEGVGPAHLPSSLRRTRPNLRVQDGCEVGCSYCVVPTGRGRYRSMTLGEIGKHLELLEKEGAREVVVCGINLGAWGRDLTPRGRLLDLLRYLEEEAPIQRVRLSSIEPWSLEGEAELALLGRSRRLAPHLHLPLQSGDDDILERMGRPHDVAQFRSLIRKLTEARPGIAIGTDVIAGFPGESSEAFERTLSLVEELPLAYLHVFAFSARPGTRATAMAPTIAAREIRSRVSKLREEGKAKRRKYLEALVGTVVHPVFEVHDRETGLLRGTAGRFVTVVAEGPGDLVGELVAVKAESIADGSRLRGRIAER